VFDRHEGASGNFLLARDARPPNKRGIAMPSTYIECPSCGEEGKVDEAVLGRKIKCRKCGNSFIAEVGGTYDLKEVRPRTAGPSPTRRPAPPDPDPDPDDEPKKGKSDDEPNNSWLEQWPDE
jgi:hypothetical protein